MLESVAIVLAGMLTSGKAMAMFDAVRKGKKGNIRALIEELKNNSRLCFRVVNDGVDHRVVISKFSTSEYDRLNKSGFNFNALKRAKIPAFEGIQETDLASWPGKSTEELIENIYDKIKDLKSRDQFKPDGRLNRRRLINIHKRILLLLRHVRPR
ncbi:MAG: hypothetical protein JKY51_05620 [Opitutaceae bacterium]|nr:hypothetical protein [Opitutaceae bacterium]